MIERRISPAGDPFTSVLLRGTRTARRTDEQDPCGCYGGYHYVGHRVEGEDGEEAESFEAVPCRWCSSAQ